MDTDSQLARLGLFDARVPRYTSYPTAPHFAQGFAPATFAHWVGQIAKGDRISLYLHVPFCRRLCWFCACRTQGTSTDSPVASYVEVLKAELRLLKARLAPDVRLSRLHWGGGTPTLLTPEMIRDLAAAVFAVAPLAEGAEFSVEIDPNELDDARLQALADMGMNRASIGVQDFDPEIQQMIGRLQSYEVTAWAASAIRAHGVESLNCDILYGLPDQTPEKIARSVTQLLTLQPDRVALYGYAHVPWVSRRQQMIPSENLPNAEDRLQLYEVARDLFLQAGYVEIGIDHFAKPSDGLAKAQAAGRLRRNFQGYTDDPAQVLIGLGASSISRFPQGFVQNEPATGAYTKAIRAGGFAVRKGHAFAGEDLLRARIIEALMCDFAVSGHELMHDFDLAPQVFAQMVAPVLVKFGDMVRFEGNVLSIPPRARPLTRMIARMFDAYDMGQTAHSSAI